MWPFKSKEVEEQESWQDRQKKIIAAEIAEVRAWRDVGDEFNYLGIKCQVTKCSTWGGWCMLPCIEADYIDNNGIIHHISFKYSNLDWLIKQNEPNAVISGASTKTNNAVL